MRLEEIIPGARIKGILAGEIVEIIAARSYGPDAVEITYKSNGGGVEQTIVFRSTEATLELEAQSRRFAFDGDGHLMRLASEALRIRLAHLCTKRTRSAGADLSGGPAKTANGVSLIRFSTTRLSLIPPTMCDER